MVGEEAEGGRVPLVRGYDLDLGFLLHHRTVLLGYALGLRSYPVTLVLPVLLARKMIFEAHIVLKFFSTKFAIYAFR